MFSSFLDGVAYALSKAFEWVFGPDHDDEDPLNL